MRRSAGFPEHVLPDYERGSLVNLMASLVTALDGETPYAPLRLPPPEEVSAARHVVLLVVNGLGHAYVQARESALRAHLRGRIASVFPSTTAAAIPAFLTGLAPQQHGLLGWHMYFREVGVVCALLPFAVPPGRQFLRGAAVNPGTLFVLTPLADRLPCPSAASRARPSPTGRFEACVESRPGDRVWPVKSGTALHGHWLGPGAPRDVHLGVHGGTSEAEMYVPLIVARP